MRQDPVFSGGVFKVVLVVLAAVALGVGAFAIAGGGIDVKLPDLPDLDTAVPDPTTVEQGAIEDALEPALQPPSEPTGGGDPFTSSAFGSALRAVRGEVGSGAELTRLFINGTQTQFIVRRGSGIEAVSVRADSGELVREEATISISGSATIDDFAFPLDGVKPSAIDRMLSAARKQSGAKSFEPTVLTLERQIPFGSRELEWTINAQAGGRYVLYRAAPDGSKVRNEGGEGIAVPPAAQQAQRLNECISAAGEDTAKIFRCLEEL